MSNPYVYQTERLLLKVLDESSARAVLDYYARNRSFHQPWFGAREPSVFTLDHQRRLLADDYQSFLAGRAIPLYLFLKEDSRRVIGRVALSNIVRGSFCSCFLGYHLDERFQGQGHASEAIDAAIRIAFKDFGLHRIEANIMPRNIRSINLVKRLGFSLEGSSTRYLEINGVWEDHLHFVRLNEAGASETNPSPEWITDRLSIRLFEETDLPSILRYHEKNLTYFRQYNPVPDDLNEWTHIWRTRLANNQFHWQQGLAHHLGLFLIDRPETLVGQISFETIEPIPFSACEISFSSDSSMSGRGILFEAMTTLLPAYFDMSGLHRFYARVRADHEASLKLLRSLGFSAEANVREGMFMDGAWHDYVTMSVLKKEFLGMASSSG